MILKLLVTPKDASYQYLCIMVSSCIDFLSLFLFSAHLFTCIKSFVESLISLAVGIRMLERMVLEGSVVSTAAIRLPCTVATTAKM